ncbi:MAG: DUF350 domain-containing protein [candidate division KSB1 bacterium]|nr:DUF350 domain-containing protein [candidate division KSB1 bacterium]
MRTWVGALSLAFVQLVIRAVAYLAAVSATLWLFSKITGLDVREEIGSKRNIGFAILLTGVLLGLAYVMATV